MTPWSSTSTEPDYIIEERSECVVSPTAKTGNHLKNCHFLKPHCVNYNNDKHPSLGCHSKPTMDIQSLPLKVVFRGTKAPPENWKSWVFCLHAKHHQTWRKAGIEKAIICSTFHIHKDDDLILEFANRWCLETNTFIFPWGEATVTLEDMLVLGGFSVLGESVSANNFECGDADAQRISPDLIKTWKLIRRENGGICCPHKAFLNHFMGLGNELEHVAFLWFWLSRFVFPRDYILISCFDIALRLSRGCKFALGPAVLAHIYRDLSVLKQNIVYAMHNNDDSNVLPVWVYAPFQLVLVWIWERFPTLSPPPNLIKPGEPRVARWHELNKVKVGDVGFAIKISGECFQWRPYAAALRNWSHPSFYKDVEDWVSVCSDMDRELEFFARCIRVSVLFGLEYTEKYLPHRVARQFGFDQDVPGHVPGTRIFTELAWSHYNRPVGDRELYIPSRFSKPDVTLRYLTWWKDLMSNDELKFLVPKKRRSQRASPSVLNLKKGPWNIVKEHKLAPFNSSFVKHSSLGDGFASNENVSRGTEFLVSSDADTGLIRNELPQGRFENSIRVKFQMNGVSYIAIHHAEDKK